MNHLALWKALEAQASSWSTMPVFQRFASPLPRNALQRSSGLPGVLQEMQAGGVWVGSRPLRAASIIPMMLASVPRLASGKADAALDSWLDDARRVESAHRQTIAWLRSRLPGYPRMPAPQLVPGTSLTTREFTWRLTWAPEERSLGLQFDPGPRNAGTLLGATTGEAHRLDEGARSVAAAFIQTDEWRRLAAATADLDEEARERLQVVRATLKRRLADDAIDEHEPDLALPRDQYRRAVLSEELESLLGSAREYTEAFAGADQLVETAASDVFGQLAAYADVTAHSRPRDLDTQPGGVPTIAFTATGDSLWEVGMLAWIDDPLILDAIHVTGLQMSFDRATGITQRVTAEVLTDTATAWRSPS